MSYRVTGPGWRVEVMHGQVSLWIRGERIVWQDGWGPGALARSLKRAAQEADRVQANRSLAASKAWEKRKAKVTS